MQLHTRVPRAGLSDLCRCAIVLPARPALLKCDDRTQGQREHRQALVQQIELRFQFDLDVQVRRGDHPLHGLARQPPAQDALGQAGAQRFGQRQQYRLA